MADDAVAIAQRTRSWLPAVVEARGQQFISVRAMAPYGDRRNFALSGRRQDQVKIFVPSKHQRREHVVRELILLHGLQQPERWRLTRAPNRKFPQCGEGWKTTLAAK